MLAEKRQRTNNRCGGKMDGPKSGHCRLLDFSAAREVVTLTYSRTLWQRVTRFFSSLPLFFVMRPESWGVRLQELGTQCAFDSKNRETF